MKIASWNVNSLRARLSHVCKWLASEKPDLLALQEIKVTDDEFPTKEFNELGYHAVCNGQAGYNGVAIVSRVKPSHVTRRLPDIDQPEARVIAANYNALHVINVYVPNGQEVGSDQYSYKLYWLDKLASYLKDQLVENHLLAVTGDFNIAPDEQDVYNKRLWEGQIMFSGPEREAFQNLLHLGLVDTFRLFPQPDRSFSWWDYRLNAFRRNNGVRIDHVLSSPALATDAKSCWIDKTPRGWEKPSDHAPIVGEFAM